MDPLTGLYNRDFVFETLEKVLERVRRGDKNSYCLAYIDLDGFKSVNDRYGHHEGDRVLKDLSRRILSRFRKETSWAE
ncbi:MAG: GGDEF domain-containing protein [Aquificota bacterium]|nr:GGDEF domain-containing protein [Aquificota bacterium]